MPRASCLSICTLQPSRMNRWAMGVCWLSSWHSLVLCSRSYSCVSPASRRCQVSSKAYRRKEKYMRLSISPEKVAGKQRHEKPLRWSGLGELFPILFGVFWLIVAVFPILYMLTTSLRPLADFFTDVPWLPPSHPTVGNYQYVLENDFGLYFANTVFVTVTSVLIIVIVSLLAAYAISKI